MAGRPAPVPAEGPLLCCDGCPAAFHFACLGIVADGDYWQPSEGYVHPTDAIGLRKIPVGYGWHCRRCATEMATEQANAATASVANTSAPAVKTEAVKKEEKVPAVAPNAALASELRAGLAPSLPSADLAAGEEDSGASSLPLGGGTPSSPA